jgi:two-component system sensor histidine kinase RegB
MAMSDDERIAPAGSSAPPMDAAAPLGSPSAADGANRKNMLLLIQMRWIAVMGQIVTIAVVQVGMGVELPLAFMAIVLGGQIGLNLTSLAWLRGRETVGRHGLLMMLLLDVVALTAQLWLSGGATNPFISLYLLQVTIGAVLLDVRSAWVLAVLACASFVGLAVSSRSLVLPARSANDMLSLHIGGMLVCFVVDAALLVVFVTRMARNLRERDARLAALRQHAAEEDHVVRMGLLATGAAHELGTPLASLAVILGDWRRMPAVAANLEMMQELEEMQAAVRRCKTIVTDILMSSGEARGEAPAMMSINAFLDGLVNEWRVRRPTTVLSYKNLFTEELAIISDSALKQVIFNVLDNAFEASPAWVGLTAERSGGEMVLRVDDAGPGFTPEMLAQFGKPYRSSKGRPGGGLGLFLLVNVARKLGGSAQARNRPGGGASVTVNLPLAALAAGPLHHAR